MSVQVSARFAFSFEQETAALLQFEAAELPEQQVTDIRCDITRTEHLARVPSQDDIGERVWLRGSGRIAIDYSARVEVNRDLHRLEDLAALDPSNLPGETVSYLFDSRYCRADKFQKLVSSEFGESSGGARIAAIREWIARHFRYVPGASDVNTDATDTYVSREGICRDYAHVLVTMARASMIPARYVACYAPGVEPQDFHAIAEVFLADPSGVGGTWQMVDATGMADLAHAVKIGVGRDAADVSFVTSFGPMKFEYSKVEVSQGN